LTRYLLRRLLFAGLLVLASSSAALLLTRLAPADVSAQLGPRAQPEEIASVRARFDLDRSPLRQWALWLARASRFDFGHSFLYGRPVAALVASAAANTAVLAVAALLLATVAGIGLGIYTGSRRGALSSLVRGISIVCVSLPPLVTSLPLVVAAAATGWLPVGGMSSAGVSAAGWTEWAADVLWHLPLPAVALALPIGATFERLQAHTMAEAVREPFVLAAAARGVAPADLVLRHAWRAAVRPICAVYGIAVGALLSGSFAVEYVTAWPGLGRLMYDALRARDIYLVTGCAAMGALFLAVGSLVGDLLHAVADPRVREGSVT
jgi:peptide/nickel transport system permease protein